MSNALKDRLLNEDHNYHEVACHEAWAKIETLTVELGEALEDLSASQGYIADAIFALDKQKKAEAERDKYESAWMTAEGKLADVEAERDRLRETLGKLECKCSSNCDWERDDVCPSWIARAALKGETL